MGFKKWFVIGILIVLTFSSTASTLVLFVLREREMDRRFAAEESLMKALRAKSLLENELRLREEKSARLEGELLTLKRTNEFTLVHLRGLDKKVSRLERQLVKERSEKQTIAKEKTDLNNHLSLQVPTSGSPAEDVHLGQIVVSATPNLEGKVLVVNPKFRFVIVDLGSEEKMDPGTVLNIYRSGQYIGKVQVEEVRESVSACRILPEWTRQEIRENDYVKEL